MRKLSVQFYYSTFQKLQENAAKKDMPLAQYVRELVDIGLRVEEMSAHYSNEDKQSESHLPENSKVLWKNNLLWSLESLYLIRCLMNDVLPDTKEQYFHTAKQKAQDVVENYSKNRVSFLPFDLCIGIAF